LEDHNIAINDFLDLFKLRDFLKDLINFGVGLRTLKALTPPLKIINLLMNGRDVSVELSDHVGNRLLEFVSLLLNTFTLHTDLITKGEKKLGGFMDRQVVLLSEDTVNLEQVDKPLFAVLKL
jgi:hypothetical protein